VIDIAIARGPYSSDEDTQRAWTGAAAPDLYGRPNQARAAP
jgi:hypothetical protein